MHDLMGFLVTAILRGVVDQKAHNIIAGSTIVSYLIYTTLSQDYAMILTAPFVIYGLFRYLYLVHQRGLSPEPENILKDKGMLVNLGIWGLMVISIALYGLLV